MEVKFRAWDKKKNEWLHLTEEVYLSEQGDIMRMQETPLGCDILRFCDSEPEFYIGVDDKHGDKIFQKDFVTVGIHPDAGDIFLIDWRGCGFWFIDDEGHCIVLDSRSYNIEIIGNIHENPDYVANGFFK